MLTFCLKYVDFCLKCADFLLATGEEVQLQSLIRSNDEDQPKPIGRSYSDSYSDSNRKGECNLCLRKLHTIGTWNVRSMNIGKLEIVKNEMERNNLDLLGISEMRWTDRGHSIQRIIQYTFQEVNNEEMELHV